MAQICIESQQWITENITKPVDTWISQTQNVCSSWPWPFNWLCSLVVVIIRVVVYVVEAVARVVSAIICVIAVVLNFIGFIYNLILSIPGLGRIIKLALTAILEFFWRIFGIFGLADGLLSLAGARAEKKMSLKLIILKDENGKPVAAERDFEPMINEAATIFKTLCNIRLLYRGACIPDVNAPTNALDIIEDAGGTFAQDLGTRGSYYEFVSSTCAYD